MRKRDSHPAPGFMSDTQAKYDYVGAIIRYEAGEMGNADTLELFAYLLQSGLAYQLQGHYGRVASALIQQAYLSEGGDILRDVDDD